MTLLQYKTLCFYLLNVYLTHTTDKEYLGFENQRYTLFLHVYTNSGLFFKKKNPHVIYFFLCWSFPISFNYCNLILLSCSKSSIYYYTVHCYKIYIQTPDFISYCIVSNDGKMYIFPFSLTFQRRMNVWHCILCFLTNGWRAICKNQIF